MALLRIDSKEINLGLLLGTRLRYIREQTCSQQDMARMLVEKCNTLQNYELGYRSVSVEVILKFIMLYRQLWERHQLGYTRWYAGQVRDGDTCWDNFLYYLFGYMPAAQVPLFERELTTLLTPVRDDLVHHGIGRYSLDAIQTSWVSDYVLTFPAWIKTYRKVWGIGCRRFSERVGLTRSTLWQWEEGRRLMSVQGWLRFILASSEEIIDTIGRLTATYQTLPTIKENLMSLTFNNTARLNYYLTTGELP